MNYIVAAKTDIGTTKDTNQDSFSVKVINTQQGRMVFAVLCDGMGGLAKGEVASATVIKAFDKWVNEDLPTLCRDTIEDYVIREQWCSIIEKQNELIKTYGERQGLRLGTTAVVMLLTQDKYYILNVGDSRAYELSSKLKQITVDQTFVAREVALGNMTEEQAKLDERRNVLLQCVGASDKVYPEMFYGDVLKDSVYMLCSDGFRHEVTSEEIFENLRPELMTDDNIMYQHAETLINVNKQRNERDNISVVLIRTF